MADEEKITRKQFATNLKREYPRFGQVPDDQLVDMILQKYPKYRERIVDLQTLPQGEVHRPATGVRGAENTTLTAVSNFQDWVRKNFDVIGGTVGGLAGGIAGGPPGALLGATLGGGAGRAQNQLSEFAKGKGQTSSLDAATDIAIGGLEQGAQELGGAGIAKLGDLIRPASRVAKLSYGTGAGELGPALKELIPDFDKAISRSGLKSVNNIGELKQVAETTERSLNTEFAIALQPIRGATLPAGHPGTDAVGRAIRGQITASMAKDPETRLMQRYLERRANLFELNPWTVGELNARRELLSKRLKAWHAAEASGQAAGVKVQAKIAADAAEEQALKDLLYPYADRAGVKPPGYFEQLKRKQSSLIDFLDAIDKNAKTITKRSYEEAGKPVSEKLHVRTYLHPRGAPGAVGHSHLGERSSIKSSSEAIRAAFPKGAAKATRAVRTGVGKALSSRDINALPIRALFSNWDNPVPESQEGAEQ